MNLPDTRGWALIGLFALATYIFTLIALNPKLAEIQLFGALATVVISGGLGGAIHGFIMRGTFSQFDLDGERATNGKSNDIGHFINSVSAACR